MQLTNEYIDKVVMSFDVPSKLTTDAAWDKLQKRIDAKPATKKGKEINFNFILGSVAASLVFIVVLYLGMFKIGRFSPDIKSNTLQAQTVVLPDSSIMIVNSNSCAKFHYNKFTGNRNIQMNGEVFFDVRSGKNFQVDFKGGNISVLGTKFTVVAYNSEFLYVECYEGEIDFKHNRSTYRIKKGEGMKVNDQQVSKPYVIDNNSFNERINGVYYWDRISLGELAFFIGERFNYRIIIDKEIEKRNFSGKLDLSELNNGLNIVSFAMDLSYSINDEEQTITLNAKTTGSHI